MVHSAHILAEPALNFDFGVKEALRQFGNWEAETGGTKTSQAAARLCIKARQKLNLVLDAAAHLGSCTCQNCIILISSKFTSWTAQGQVKKSLLLKLPGQGYCHGLFQDMC